MIKTDCLYYEKSNDMGATIHWCQNYPHLNFDCDKCERYIEKHFVRVVRCKDCKFYRKTAATTIDYFDYINGNTENKKPLYMCDNDVIDWATPEDYCSLGERRENETN